MQTTIAQKSGTPLAPQQGFSQVLISGVGSNGGNLSISIEATGDQHSLLAFDDIVLKDSDGVQIPVQNPSFEFPMFPPNGYSREAPYPTGWEYTNPTVGYFNQGGAWNPLLKDLAPVPNGKQVGWTQGGGVFSQDLPTRSDPTKTYQLSLSVAGQVGHLVSGYIVSLFAKNVPTGGLQGTYPLFSSTIQASVEAHMDTAQKTAKQLPGNFWGNDADPMAYYIDPAETNPDRIKSLIAEDVGFRELQLKVYLPVAQRAFNGGNALAMAQFSQDWNNQYRAFLNDVLENLLGLPTLNI